MKIGLNYAFGVNAHHDVGLLRNLVQSMESLGFSSLWIDGPSTDRFVADVVSEVAAMTPGPYLHIGGDEGSGPPVPGSRAFQHRLQETVCPRRF